MKRRTAHTANRAIRLIGLLLGLYLTVLIAFGYVGQRHLSETLLAQERLSVEKQATAISYLIAGRQALIDELAQGRPVHAYLADRDLGMSMRHGLEPSLDAVARDFRRVLDGKRIEGQRVFGRIRLIMADGQTLLDVHGDPSAEPGERHFARSALRPGMLSVERRDDGVFLSFAAPVRHKDRVAAYLAADIDAVRVVRPLLVDSADHTRATRSALVDLDDQVVVASGGNWRNWRTAARGRGDDVISAPVAGQPLLLVSLPDPGTWQSALTSPLFLAALAFMSLPLLIGIMRLLRLSNHNLVLKTRFQTTRQQRAMLRKQNERLQREIDKRVASEQKLAHQANYDQLTGLPNRSLALDRLSQAVKWAHRDGSSVLVLFLDLDRFKQVNDSLGHAAGDELLREASQRLQAQVRDSDTVSRLGGDEFLVICPEPAAGRSWEDCAQRMLRTLAQPFYIGDHEFFVGASIGVAAYPEGGTEPHRLLKNADIAMYSAKELGRNRYCYYDPSMDAEAMQLMKLENNLRHALARDEFHLLYQPIVELSSGRTVAVEALLRWDSRHLGLVPPDKFIPVAEETGVIHDIGEWVLNEACLQIGSLHPARDFRVAINLSTRQFSRPGRLLDCVLLALRQSGLMPSQLELEITESVLIDDRPEIAEFIGQLDRIGVRLSIDDFGTGYSALNYLQRFPFDVLKIDRSFTSEIPDNEASASLIRAIIAMAHALGLVVVAEGIEERTQTGFLLVQHCEYGQGYLYSKPVDIEQLRAHLIGEQVLTA